MPDDYRVKPYDPQPGNELGPVPTPGQTVDYLYENGDLASVTFTFVGPPVDYAGDVASASPNGRYCPVAGELWKNVNGEKANTLVSNPVSNEFNAWTFDRKIRKAKWCPCGPPWPAHCP
jgi:hypothetical protein